MVQRWRGKEGAEELGGWINNGRRVVEQKTIETNRDSDAQPERQSYVRICSWVSCRDKPLRTQAMMIFSVAICISLVSARAPSFDVERERGAATVISATHKRQLVLDPTLDDLFIHDETIADV